MSKHQGLHQCDTLSIFLSCSRYHFHKPPKKYSRQLVSTVGFFPSSPHTEGCHIASKQQPSSRLCPWGTSKSMYTKTLYLSFMQGSASIHVVPIRKKVGSPGTLSENRTLASSREGNLRVGTLRAAPTSPNSYLIYPLHHLQYTVYPQGSSSLCTLLVPRYKRESWLSGIF